jgi:hypothetical protein
MMAELNEVVGRHRELTRERYVAGTGATHAISPRTWRRGARGDAMILELAHLANVDAVGWRGGSGPAAEVEVSSAALLERSARGVAGRRDPRATHRGRCGMANLVMARSVVHPSGTTVGLYLAVQAQPGRQGPRCGSAIITAAARDAIVTLTGADAGKPYVAYASAGGLHRYVSRIQ